MPRVAWRFAPASGGGVYARTRDALERLRTIELEDLEPRNAGNWPAPARMAATALAFAVVLALTWVAWLAPRSDALSAGARAERQMADARRDKGLLAAPLGAEQARRDALQADFSALLATLPTGTEVPGLLEDIARAALVHDLTVERIELGVESPSELYFELPIEIVLTGTYHGIGAFAGAVAGLPRVVTLHDFEVTRPATGRDLRVTMRAKTYRRRDPSEAVP
ncbi:MAG: type 4a pilus biogenesis protein PilO [Gammaproteobacteria bacterium]|nr:type 4a pilus biogenesis protein PilO [Gammaproteobacteria bacterium]